MPVRLLILGLGWVAIGGLYVLQSDEPVLEATSIALRPRLDAERSTPRRAQGREADAAEDAAGSPIQVVIPKIGVDAEVIPVGMTADKKMQIPKSAAKLGWFAPGTRPGNRGNAVITGHMDTVLGTEGVFYRLHELVVGDVVRVVDHSGRTRTFRVTALRMYDPKKAPMEEIFGASDGYHLNLITCRGNWEIENGTYDERLVVFTEAVSPI